MVAHFVFVLLYLSPPPLFRREFRPNLSEEKLKNYFVEAFADTVILFKKFVSSVYYNLAPRGGNATPLHAPLPEPGSVVIWGDFAIPPFPPTLLVSCEI